MILKSILIFKYFIRFAKFIFKQLFEPDFVIYKILLCRLKALFGLDQLERLYISPSYQCNANCEDCSELHDKHDSDMTLSLATVKGLIDQHARLGGAQVSFCSGEFLMHPDALEMVRYASSRGMRTLIVTNGSLITKEKVKLLKECGLYQLFVSVDSADAATHDELRGYKGLHEKAINAIKLTRNAGIQAWICTCVRKNRLEDLESVVEISHSIKAEGVMVLFPVSSGKLKDKPEMLLTIEERRWVRDRFRWVDNVVLEFPTEGSRCKGLKKQMANIMPNGDITLCPFVDEQAGNIHSESLIDGVKKLRALYKSRSHCSGQCIANF